MMCKKKRKKKHSNRSPWFPHGRMQILVLFFGSSLTTVPTKDFSIGDTSPNGCFSIVMLVFGGFFELPKQCPTQGILRNSPPLLTELQNRAAFFGFFKATSLELLLNSTGVPQLYRGSSTLKGKMWVPLGEHPLAVCSLSLPRKALFLLTTHMYYRYMVVQI